MPGSLSQIATDEKRMRSAAVGEEAVAAAAGNAEGSKWGLAQRMGRSLEKRPSRCGKNWRLMRVGETARRKGRRFQEEDGKEECLRGRGSGRHQEPTAGGCWRRGVVGGLAPAGAFDGYTAAAGKTAAVGGWSERMRRMKTIGWDGVAGFVKMEGSRGCVGWS